MQTICCLGSIVGITFSIILAVVFTTLDRYVSLIYSYMNWCSIFLSCGLFVLFYTVEITTCLGACNRLRAEALHLGRRNPY